MKTLVLGMGNPYGGDDGVGLAVVRALRDQIYDPEVVVQEASLAGVRLLEMLAGYDQAIIVDAIQTERGRPGSIHILSPEDLGQAKIWNPSSHGLALVAALEKGRKTGLALPEQVIIFAIEVNQLDDLSERISPEAEQAIPQAVEMVLAELGRGGSDA